MASVWKHPKSQFFTACFTDKTGRRRKRSTQVSDRRKAQKIADEFEAVARGKKSLSQIRRVMSELTKEVIGRELETVRLADYVMRWVNARKGEVKPATFVFYKAKSDRFLEFMRNAGRGDASLLDVSREDIQAWRDDEASRVSAKTVNHGLKLLRMIFRQARVVDNLIADDPTEQVKTLTSKGQKIARRPFSQEELQLVLRNCDAEWRSMVLFGCYTSHRLSDIATLTWRDLDLEGREVRYTTRKTGAVAIVPMHDDLYEHILSLSAPDDPNVPVHARAHAVMTKGGRNPQLSNGFAEILVKAGLRPKDWRQGTGAGGRRRGSALSFHSLRHTFISEMQRSGVSATITGDLAGHKTADMTRVYTHIDKETKREAIKKLPKVRRTAVDDGQMELGI